VLIEIIRKRKRQRRRETGKCVLPVSKTISNLLLFFSGRGDCCLAAKMGSQGCEWRLRSLTHLGWGLRVCVSVR